MKSIAIEKSQQVIEILREKGIDLWLNFVRESHVIPDPALSLVLPVSLTWQSAIMFFADGEKIAIVGELDRKAVEDIGTMDRVLTYRVSIKDKLLQVLDEKRPCMIAINYSLDNPLADGLTHGMFLLLKEYLEGTPYLSRLHSAEEVIAALRSRKTPVELSLIKKAIEKTLQLFHRLSENLREGLSEREIAYMLKGWMKEEGLEPAWDEQTCPAVFAGPQEVGAHSAPGEKRLRKGHVLNIDFGVRFKGYVSDLQRVWYLRRENEIAPPEEVLKAFETVKKAIREAASQLKPGRQGWEIDKVARQIITGAGYPEYPHALGHQVGTQAHDGGALLAPLWERYGSLPRMPVEEGMVFTLEPRVNLPQYGVVSVEEMVVVRKDGAEFLSEPQEEIWIVG